MKARATYRAPEQGHLRVPLSPGHFSTYSRGIPRLRLVERMYAQTLSDEECVLLAAAIRDRFVARVDVDPSGCWLWTGACSGGGYAQLSVRIKGRVRTLRASRLAYELFIGSFDPDDEIDHLCHSMSSPALCPGGDECLHRRCVNPWHLEPVTSAENDARSEPWRTAAGERLRQTHCHRGHPLSGENLATYARPGGGAQRVCRACRRENLRAWRQRQKGLAA